MALVQNIGRSAPRWRLRPQQILFWSQKNPGHNFVFNAFCLINKNLIKKIFQSKTNFGLNPVSACLGQEWNYVHFCKEKDSTFVVVETGAKSKFKRK